MMMILLQNYLLLLVFASSTDEPHWHEGKAERFVPGDPKISLNDVGLKKLENGDMHEIVTTGGMSKRIFHIQDVHAPPVIIWKRILDFNNYNAMEFVYGSNTYEKGLNKYTHMKINFSFWILDCFIQYEYYPNLKSLVLSLDYSKKSDVDDFVGFWYVIPHPDRGEKGDWSRVYYSIDVTLNEWIPTFIRDIFVRNIATLTLNWIKKESEKEWYLKEKLKRDSIFKTAFQKFLKTNKKPLVETITQDTDFLIITENEMVVENTYYPSPAGYGRVVLVLLVYVLLMYNILLLIFYN